MSLRVLVVAQLVPFISNKPCHMMSCHMPCHVRMTKTVQNIGFFMPVMLFNPKPNEVCFNVAYFPFEIANIMPELNESTKRVSFSDLFLDSNTVS